MRLKKLIETIDAVAPDPHNPDKNIPGEYHPLATRYIRRMKKLKKASAGEGGRHKKIKPSDMGGRQKKIQKSGE